MSENGYDRRAMLAGGVAVAAAGLFPVRAVGVGDVVPVRVETRNVVGDLPHIWSQCAGSDRAGITLRESWRADLDRWRNEVGLKQVRFHGILNDELGVDTPSIISRKPVPNFRLVDQVYDGLQDRGVDPLVELSFMPKGIAGGTKDLIFTYGGKITPPISAAAWADFLKLFVTHLIDRYGISTVLRWPFEVWNEPNLPAFWAGTQQDYFELYKAAAVAIKSVDPRLRVGGPATSSTSWLPEFADYCAKENAPIDFFSTHIYAGDNQKALFGSDTKISQNEVVPLAIGNARKRIDATPFAGRPLWISEWSSDSPAMIAHVINESVAHCQLMSPWALSAEFEELGIPDFTLKEGDTGWGMVTAGIAKPAFNTYKLMQQLGTKRLETTGPVIATRRDDRSVSALVWNLAEAKQPSGIPGVSHTRTVVGQARSYAVEFAGAAPGRIASVRYVDQARGSPMPAWRAMGSPQYPSQHQIAALRRAADIAPPQKIRLDADRKVRIDLPPEGIALIELA